MSATFKLRLVAFGLAIVALVTMVAWAASGSWRRIGQLRDRLTTVQLESFRLADHFQETILGLNNTVLWFQLRPDAEVWDRFLKASQALDRWIDEQRPSLTTPREQRVLDQINAAYDLYLAAANQVHGASQTAPSSGQSLVEFARFQRESERLLSLSAQLAEAHRKSLDLFLAQFKESLLHLQLALLGALALLLCFGLGLAIVTYRELIAPLQVKLVESQALLEHHEKLASLGMLAAGVAHEIRNPLTAIKARLFTQQKLLAPGTPERNDAELIGQEINRLERIVHDFLRFGRPSEPQFEVVAADQPLREVCGLLGPQLAKLSIRLVAGEMVSAPVQIDLEQIKQVLINLVQNAADSIGRDGVVTLRSRAEWSRLGNRLAEVVMLEVSDTGKGIPPEVQKRLFDPFFSTKQGGTGLGLSIAARITERHGGGLRYQTQVDHGTTFAIVLPRATLKPPVS